MVHDDAVYFSLSGSDGVGMVWLKELLENCSQDIKLAINA